MALKILQHVIYFQFLQLNRLGVAGPSEPEIVNLLIIGFEAIFIIFGSLASNLFRRRNALSPKQTKMFNSYG